MAILLSGEKGRSNCHLNSCTSLTSRIPDFVDRTTLGRPESATSLRRRFSPGVNSNNDTSSNLNLDIYFTLVLFLIQNKNSVIIFSFFFPVVKVRSYFHQNQTCDIDAVAPWPCEISAGNHRDFSKTAPQEFFFDRWVLFQF